MPTLCGWKFCTKQAQCSGNRFFEFCVDHACSFEGCRERRLCGREVCAVHAPQEDANDP